MRCKKCGYNLRELRERRCPECGRRFDPARGGSYLTSPVSGRRALVLVLLGALLAAIPLLLARLGDLDIIDLTGLPEPVILVGPVLLIAGGVLAFNVLLRSARAVFGKLPWIEGEKSFLAAFAISLLLMLAWGWFFVYKAIESVLS